MKKKNKKTTWLSSFEVASAASWQWGIRTQPIKVRQSPAGKHHMQKTQAVVRQKGVTPPIDQRPSSSLLSSLQFVNFSKSRVDSGRAAQGRLSVPWDFGASGLTSREELSPPSSSSSSSPCAGVGFHGVSVEVIYCRHSNEVSNLFTVKSSNVQMTDTHRRGGKRKTRSD